jgi:O-acetyl-ADP-ribose deacetylase
VRGGGVATAVQPELRHLSTELAAQMSARDSWMRPPEREEVPATATERQRRSQGVTELRRASLEHGSIVVSAGSVLDFGGGTDWTPGTVAIVNAANCGGLGGGGVDGAITSAGGPQLAADRRALPILEGTYMDRITTGGAVLTGPGCYGRLHAANVIHAVGPNYIVLDGLGNSLEDGDVLLSDAYRATMRAAAAAGIEFIGFSLLSAGIFRGPRSLEHVLRLGMEAIKECAYPGLQEVHLVAFMDEEQRVLVDLIEAAAAPKAEKDKPNLPEGTPEEKTTPFAQVDLVAAQRAYVAVAASHAGVDGVEVPRTGREVYVALHRCYKTGNLDFTQIVSRYENEYSAAAKLG